MRPDPGSLLSSKQEHAPCTRSVDGPQDQAEGKKPNKMVFDSTYRRFQRCKAGYGTEHARQGCLDGGGGRDRKHTGHSGYDPSVGDPDFGGVPWCIHLSTRPDCTFNPVQCHSLQLQPNKEKDASDQHLQEPVVPFLTQRDCVLTRMNPV